MKIFSKLYTYFILMVLMLLSSITQAMQAQDKREDAKCYVEVTGGVKMIVFWETTEKKLKTLPEHIQGKKVLALNEGKKQVQISKVFECKLLNKRFSSLAANNLDRKTPR